MKKVRFFLQKRITFFLNSKELKILIKNKGFHKFIKTYTTQKIFVIK